LNVLQQKRENCEMFAEIFRAAEKTIIEKTVVLRIKE